MGVQDQPDFCHPLRDLKAMKVLTPLLRGLLEERSGCRNEQDPKPKTQPVLLGLRVEGFRVEG